MLQAHGPLALLIAQILVIVAASRLLSLGVRALGQPPVIAEILAGILLGPTLFGHVFPGASSALFPAASLPALSLLSQLGLLIFLFTVGLNFETGLLTGRGRAAVIISNVSVIAPFALGFALATQLYPGLAPPGVPFAAFALFMGVAMSITALPVLARILAEGNMLRTRVGSVALACAAADDVTGWCILAFVVAVARSSSLTTAVMTAAMAAAFVLLMTNGLRPLLERWCRSRSLHATSGTALATAAMLFALAASWTTEVIGIHALFGAFLAGCIVPKANGWAAAIADRLESAVVLLLPLFFAYSGLRTRIGLLESPADWAICGVVILAAVLGKFGGSALSARLTGMSGRESLAIGILMNTRGLMELIVLNIGLDLGVVSEELFAMMVVMALVTTMATTPLLALLGPEGVAGSDASTARPLGT